MIANISPSHMATEHTLNTLRYADRVKEIKRGVKASSIIFSRCQEGRSPSPKQTKTRGNKSVPKNVKSRIEQSQYSDKDTTHLKLSSVSLHPPHVLLCSTPKIAGKNVLSPATSKVRWQSHSTPLKGMFKKNSSDGIKNTKNEGPDEAIVRKEAFPNNPKSGTSRKMQCEQRNYLGITRNVKVQAVQPIQKEVIPRNELHFTGQIKNHSPNKESNAKHFESEYQKSPENKLFLQKERENHLYLYHQQLQQLQQPPLLQKKLSYHPLKDRLSQFYQPKIEVNNEENVSTIQRSDFQIECSLGCDSHPDCQNTNNRDSVWVKEREKGESGRNNIQVLTCFQNQNCNRRIEDSVCNSQWSIEEECAVHCSSGDNGAEIYSQNNTHYGQMKQRHMSPDSKNSLQNINQDNFSTDHQDASFPVTKVSQMDSSFPIATDLNSAKTGATTLPQSSRNIDFHLNWAIRVAKDEQACKTNNIIPSIDCVSEDLMNVSDDHLSVDRPLSQDVYSGDEGMMISCNQCFVNMEVFPTDSGVLSPQANHVQKWMSLSHDHLDKNHSFSSDLFVNTKNANDDQHLILIDETKLQITAKDENYHCSNINYTETCYKDVNILPDISTNNCAGFRTPLKYDLRQEESFGALSCGSLSDSDISQANECDKHAIKCFKSRLHDTNSEETVINSSILHLNPGVASTAEAEAEANKYFSDAGNQNPQDPHLIQVSRQQGTSSVIAYSKLTKLINSSELKESQRETEDLVAGSSTEEKLNHPQNEDGCQPSGNSCDKDLVEVIKGKLIQNASVPINHFCEEDNSIPIEVFDGCNKKTDGTCGLWSVGQQTKRLIARHQEAMEKAKKLVVQSHCEQLEEMLALFKKEEYLLNKLTLLDFKDYVTQLEGILMLKTKSIQRLQGDIHQYQIHPESM